jgi:Mg-chelatase subunit ChlD
MLLLFSFAFVFSSTSSPNERESVHNRYNIVLVVDASGSMKWTDPDNLRFEAIGKFVALLAEQGNHVGSVVFSDELLLEQPMTSLNDISGKRKIVDDISGIPVSGWTNIGGALSSAVAILDEGKNPDLDSIILFMSDGNTEMSTEEERSASLVQKAEAIENARQSDYVIHCVSLNADGAANPTELSQIANATGGMFEEVVNASDLGNVYALFYEIIFGSISSGSSGVFDASGRFEGAFHVPVIGVEEINIVINGKYTDYVFTEPNGIKHTKSSLTDTMFDVIKFTDPVAGEWTYSIDGKPGDSIAVEIIFNTDLEVRLRLDEPKDEFVLSESIILVAEILQGGEVIPFEVYMDLYTCTWHLDKAVPANEGFFEWDDMFVGHFKVRERGVNTFQVTVEGEGFVLHSNKVTVNIDNTPPVFNQNIEHTVYLLPFTENITTIDLRLGVVDPLSRELTYEVISSAFNEDEYVIENAELIMNSYSLSKGSFTIRATDPLGGYAEFEVLVSTVSVTMWTLTLIGGGGLITLTILAWIAWLNLNKRFYGICYVQFYDNESDDYFEEIAITNPKRGKRRLPVKIRGYKTGFDLSKCYFQASGKRHAYFKANKVIFGQGVEGKRFQIDGDGYEVQISKRADSEKGIVVRFESHKRR